MWSAEYQLLTGGPSLELGDRRGPILKHPEGIWAQILSTMTFGQWSCSHQNFLQTLLSSGPPRFAT